MNNIFNNVEQHKIIFGEIVQNKSVRDLGKMYSKGFSMLYLNNSFPWPSHGMKVISVVVYEHVSAKNPKYFYWYNGKRYNPFSCRNSISSKNIYDISEF